MLLPPAGTSRASRTLGVAPIALLLGVAWSALGTPPAHAAPSGEKQARELFQKAEMSFNLGRFPDALEDYQAAYQAKPLPAFLFNVAQCYRNMRNYERARFFFRRYLALDPKTTNRRLVDDLIAEMTRELDKADKSDTAVALTPVAGTASAPPSAPPPAPAAAPAPAPLPALALEDHPPPAAETNHPIYKRWWFWAGAGAVVAGAVVAGILIARAGTPQGSLGTIDGR